MRPAGRELYTVEHVQALKQNAKCKAVGRDDLSAQLIQLAIKGIGRFCVRRYRISLAVWMEEKVQTPASFP